MNCPQSLQPIKYLTANVMASITRADDLDILSVSQLSTSESPFPAVWVSSTNESVMPARLSLLNFLKRDRSPVVGDILGL